MSSWTGLLALSKLGVLHSGNDNAGASHDFDDETLCSTGGWFCVGVLCVGVGADENDCTYDNDRTANIDEALKIDEFGECRDDACEFANSLQVDPTRSPIIPTDEISTSIVEQLAQIKGTDFSADNVIAASIHGQPERYDGPAFTPEECASDGYEGIQTTCSSSTGTAYSGDRYQRFVESFGDDNYYPDVERNDGVNFEGQVCQGDFGSSLASIADLIVGRNDVCITESVYPCSADSQCPQPALLARTDVEPSCEQFAETDRDYCRDAIQLVMTAPEDMANPVQALEDTGYCMPGTIGLEQLRRGCVVDYDRYVLRTCDARADGLTAEWTSDTPHVDLRGFEVELVYGVSGDDSTPMQ